MPKVIERGGELYLSYRNARFEAVEEATGLPPEHRSAALALLEKRERAASAAHGRKIRQKKQQAFRTYAEGWLSECERRGHAVAAKRSRLRNHILPHFGARLTRTITVRDVRVYFQDVSAGGRQSAQTIGQLYNVFRAVMQAAEDEGVISTNPLPKKRFLIDRGDIPRQLPADPMFGDEVEGAIFQPSEVPRVIGWDGWPPGVSVLWALLFFLGIRPGEAYALKWGAIAGAEPFRRVAITCQWSSELGLERDRKTRIPAFVPEHPALRRLLKRWLRRWGVVFGRAALPSDLIVPRSAAATHWDTGSFGDVRRAGFDRMNMRRRRAHDCRRTFISVVKSAKADADHVRRLVHPCAKDAHDAYHVAHWPELCEVVRLFGTRVRMPEVAL